MLNVEPSNLVFLKTYNTESDEIFITFTDQNDRPLEIEDKVNLTLSIDNKKNARFELSNAAIFYRTKNKKIR